MAADDPIEKIALKTFHGEIISEHDVSKKEEDSYKPIQVVR